MKGWTLAMAGALGTVIVAVATVCLTSGCASVSYLAQSVGGHVDLMNKARPVSEWVSEPSTPPALKARLELSQRMRDFAVQELKLPDNESYRRYADLGRRAAVWNLVAAPSLSLKLKTWCFPVVGCVSYRGYYDETAAKTLAAELAAQGLETSVYPVSAYSTLGKLEWLGGDPLLNTFVNLNEGDLARLIFHELAHQVVYVKDDSTFNESFATAVERLGGQRWLERYASEDVRQQLARSDGMRAEFRALVLRHKAALDAIYQGPGDDATKLEAKARTMAQLRDEHRRIKAERWGVSTVYDAWFERANNATIGLMATYHDSVPAFEALFEREGRDFERFYAAVRRLAALPRDERNVTLRQLAPVRGAAANRSTSTLQ